MLLSNAKPFSSLLLIDQVTDRGISTFMRKLSNSFTKYFNTKHERVGSLFQGPFKAKLVESEEYLLQLSKYIHKNPSELKLEFPHSVWEGKNYIWSSYGYYLSGQQHPFCDTQLISSYFSKTNPSLSYQAFVEEEMIDDPILFSSLIDWDD